MNNDKADFTQGSILKKLIALHDSGTRRTDSAGGIRRGRSAGGWTVRLDFGPSAVSTGSQVLNLVTFVVTQLAMGITVLIARYLGEKKPQQIGAVVGGAAIVFTLISADIYSCVMVFFARPDLHSDAGARGGRGSDRQLCAHLRRRHFLHRRLQPALRHLPRAR